MDLMFKCHDYGYETMQLSKVILNEKRYMKNLMIIILS